MSTIALITSDTGHASALNIKAALENKGHTVTLVDDADIGTTDFSGYDCAVCVNLTNDAGTAAAVRDLADSDGLPLLVGMPFVGMFPFGQAANQDGPCTKMNLTGLLRTAPDFEGINEIDVEDNAHPITDEFSTGVMAVTVGSNYWAVVDTGESTVGDVICHGYGTNFDDAPETMAIEAGTDDLDTPAVATGARIVVAGWCYAKDSVLSADGESLIDATVGWLVSPPGPNAPTLSVTELPGALAVEGSVFSPPDADPTDEHYQTTWQVTTAGDPDFSAPLSETTYTVPSTGLSFLYLDGLGSGVTRLIRAKHTGLTTGDSSWSAAVSGTTKTDVTRPYAPTVTVVDLADDFVSAVTSAFSHPLGQTTAAAYDPEDPLPYLAGAQWQIREKVSTDVIYDSGLLATVADPATLWRDGLDPDLEYEIRAAHYDGHLAALSAWGAWTEFTTDATPATAPDAPALTVDTCDGTGTVEVSSAVFSHPEGGATHRASRWRATGANGETVVIVTTEADELVEFTWRQLPADTYTFDVAHQDDSNRWGSYGATDTCEVLEPPPPPEWNHSGSTRICDNTLLSWDPLPLPVVSWLYDAEISATDGATWSPLFTGRTGTSYTFSITSRLDGVYYVRLRARYSGTSISGDWAYLVIRVDRTCAASVHYDFAEVTDLDDYPDWEILWERDPAKASWTPVDINGNPGGGYGILARGGDQSALHKSVLAFKELGQPTLYEAEVEFALFARECQWYAWRFMHAYLMRGGLASRATGYLDDGTRAGIKTIISCGISPLGTPHYGGTCPYLSSGICNNPCACASGCVCVWSVGARAELAYRFPTRRWEYAVSQGPATVTQEGFVSGGGGGAKAFAWETIPHMDSLIRGLRVSTRHGSLSGACWWRHTKYTLRQKVTRTVDGGIRMRSQLLGPGIDPEAGWMLDKTISFEDSQEIGCGYVGLALEHLLTDITQDHGVIFTSFSLTPQEYDDCLPAPEWPEGDAPWETESWEGQPCAVILQVYEEDRETLAWEVGDYREHDNPYLCLLESYGEQELDIVEGAAVIGQVEVIVIDRRQTAGDQDSGWMSERLAEGGEGVIHGRRCRVLRYISEELGWVVIADGPAGTPRLDKTYSAYRWTVRDTRDTERKVRAFVKAESCWLLPMGVADGWGAYTDEDGDSQWLVPPADPLTGLYEYDDTDAFGRGWVDLTSYFTGSFGYVMTPSGPVYSFTGTVEEEATILPELEAKCMAGGEAQGDPYPVSFRWEEVDVLWRLAGSGGSWNVVQPTDVRYETEGTHRYAKPRGADYPPWGDRPLVYAVDAELDDADNTEVRAVYKFLLRGLEATGTFPTDGDSIEVAIRYIGEPTDELPLHLEGITTGQLLKKLYDGEYSRPDPITGAYVSTGIRYDEDALLEMDDLVFLRLTEPVKDAREWAEKHIYAPTGWCPALDNDGRISPKSQVPPADFTGLLEVNDAITEPTPDWDAGERIVNVLRFEYPRYYRVDIQDAEAIDRLETRDVELEERSESSITNHAEQKAEYDGSAFAAIGNSNGLAVAGVAAEQSYLLFLLRKLYVFDRFKNGAATWSVPVMRKYSATERAGNWVTTDLSWFPDYLTRRRGQVTGGQIVAAHDVDCAWRIFLIEEAFPLEEGS